MKHIGNEIYHIIEKKQLVKRRIARNLEMDPSRFNQLSTSDRADDAKAAPTSEAGRSTLPACGNDGIFHIHTSDRA